MSNKWDSDRNLENGKDARVVLFTSRNKDNRGIEGFKQRHKSFLTTRSVSDLEDQFKDFVNQGVPGEESRFYISVNTRDLNKTKTDLIRKLFDSSTNRELLSPESYIAGIASKKENALTKKWMFDVDNNDQSILDDMKSIISQDPSNVIIEAVHKTPNGYHVIINHGFDTRKLLEKYPDVSLKRDDLWLTMWMKKI